MNQNNGNKRKKKKQPIPHNWDDSGERCGRCGDKDWFASRSCGEPDNEDDDYDNDIKYQPPGEPG